MSIIINFQPTMPELSKDNQKSDRKCSTFDRNSKDEDPIRLVKCEPAEPNVQNNEVTYTNISLLRGITRTPRKHKKHLVYTIFENDKRNIASDFKNNATEVTCDQSYTYIKEQVEFDKQLFSNTIYEKQIIELSPKFVENFYVKFYRCMVDGCTQKFNIKQELKVSNT
ncbi:hypothetical protein RF11_15766 [Thelohanellus kitauei]|uniref:Uncharacterized protein n=1 Tax=Thelohanellus kitauei TaxID=669202 RepID=A0A0C2NCP4_THEKT|nr:hypothetical protein RF11_15766 [Thelohanellus kitauei]